VNAPNLHPYQLVARDFLQGQPRAGLFLDMGLGKTATTLAALTDDHLPALVIAPKRVAEHVWPSETELWRPDLDLRVAAGSPDVRARILGSEQDVTVIGRDNAHDVPERHRYRTLVLDELSGYRSVSSARTKWARKLGRRAHYCWGLTGTPTPNGYLNLFAPMRILDGGQRLGTNYDGFRNRYFRPGRQIANGTIVSWEIREFSEHHIKELISDICLYMESDGRVELPAFTVNPVAVQLPPSARKIYEEMSDTLVADLTDVFGTVHSASSAAVLTNKLSQITAGFLYHDDSDLTGGTYHPLHSAKINAVQDIVEEAQGSPVLVFYRFRAEAEMLRTAISGAVGIDEPNAIARWNRGEVPVILAHPASAGHGLNLQHGGHTIVWTTPDWDLELWEQGNARLHRQGQEHPVVAHVLLGGPIDHLIIHTLEGKADVQQDLLDYLKSPI